MREKLNVAIQSFLAAFSGRKSETVITGNYCRKALSLPKEHGLSVRQHLRYLDRNLRLGTFLVFKYQLDT